MSDTKKIQQASLINSRKIIKNHTNSFDTISSIPRHMELMVTGLRDYFLLS